MKKYKIHAGFTLIELIVSIAIFGIIMVAVMAIFLFSSQMSTRVELNRIMQENIKNVMEDIAENVRKGKLGEIDSLTRNRINAIKQDGSPSSDCNEIGAGKTGTKLCLENGTQYTIGYYDDTIPGVGPWIPSGTIDVHCTDLIGTLREDSCRILKRDTSGGTYYPLTNNFIHIEDLEFRVSDGEIPKVTVSISIRPAVKKGISSDIARASTTQIQTTISERSIKTQ